MTRRTAPQLAALFSIVALAGGLAAAAPMKSDSVVKATAIAAKPDANGKQTVTLTLAIDKGWHLYANPVGVEDLASVQTTVAVKAAVAPSDVKIDYPSGKKIKDAVVGEYMIYEDKAVLTINLTRAKGDDSPVELTIKVQACNDSTCLLPAEIKVSAAP
ncbi:MAG TPA: protein-disulfide reductase DsbD N-terminal domain-containing protein [Gemmataceae bacterium]|nr:protein-disulfide reductase DsbD N-terminal domain-containing protein [Gemmataceae bacterium]